MQFNTIHSLSAICARIVPKIQIIACCFATATLVACGGGGGAGVSSSGDIPVSSGPIQAQLQAPLGVMAGQAFSLDARSSAPGVQGGELKYNWELGTTRANTVQIGHVYDLPGSYEVTLRIENERGEVATTKQTIVVTNPPTATAFATATVVVSEADGTPISGAEVQYFGRGVFTGSGGETRVLDIPQGRDWVIRVSKAGYIDSVFRGRAAPGASEISVPAILVPKAAGTVIDLSADISLTGPGGIQVLIPRGALTDGDNVLTSGTATARLTVPSGDIQFGWFFGNETVQPNGSITSSLSLRPIDIVIEQGNLRLNIANGKTARIRWPLPAPVAGEPLVDGAQLPLRTLEMTTGLWRQEGIATVVNPPVGGRAVQADVGHFSYFDSSVVSSSDFYSVIPACAINYESGLPTLEIITGGTNRCLLSVESENPYYAYYPNLVSARSTCSLYNGAFVCNISRSSRYTVFGLLPLFAQDVMLRERQDYSANDNRAQVTFRVASSYPLRNDRIRVAADGIVSSNLIHASTTVNLSAQVRSVSQWGPFEFVSSISGSLGMAPSASPTLVVNTLNLAEGEHTVLARSQSTLNNAVISSFNTVNVKVDRTAPALSLISNSGGLQSINGVSNAPVTGALVMRFAEPLVARPNFQITPQVTGVFSGTGTVWQFTPAVELSFATAYSISLSGLVDIAGNTGSAQAGFTTLANPNQGSFSWVSQQVAGGASQKVAHDIGNGDYVLVPRGLQTTAANGQVFFKSSSDAAFSAVNGLSITGVLPAGANSYSTASASGHLIASWREGTNTVVVDKISSQNGQLTKTRALSTATFATGSYNVLGASAVNAAGDMAVLFGTGNVGSEVLSVQYTLNGVWQTPKVVRDTGRPRVENSRILRDQSGRIHVLYYTIAANGTDRSLRYSQFTIAGDTVVEQTLLTGSGASMTPSLAADLVLKSNDQGALVLGLIGGQIPTNPGFGCPCFAYFGYKPATDATFQALRQINVSVARMDVGIGSNGVAYGIHGVESSALNSSFNYLDRFTFAANGAFSSLSPTSDGSGSIGYVSVSSNGQAYFAYGDLNQFSMSAYNPATTSFTTIAVNASSASNPSAALVLDQLMVDSLGRIFVNQDPNVYFYR
jgi:PKD domain